MEHKSFFPYNYYAYPTNPHDVLKDMIELANDVEQGYHIPVRFRKRGMNAFQREKYVQYLQREIEKMKAKLNSYQ